MMYRDGPPTCASLFSSAESRCSVWGVIGQYIGKTYAEAKKRPHYIASECSDEQIKKVG